MAELGVFIGVLGGVVTSIILTVQKSKCETIACCGVHCKRRVEKDKITTPPKKESETLPLGAVSAAATDVPDAADTQG